MLEATRTNLANVGMHYLECLQIPVTKTELKQRLEEQPFYPSLFSLKAVFDHYKIPNQAFSLKQENLDQAEPPFIAYAHDGVSRDFILVTQISETKVRYISNGNRSKEVTKEKFLEMWEKIIFVAEKNELSGDKEYHKKQKEENSKYRQRYALSATAIAAIALLTGLTFLQIPASL